MREQIALALLHSRSNSAGDPGLGLQRERIVALKAQLTAQSLQSRDVAQKGARRRWRQLLESVCYGR